MPPCLVLRVLLLVAPPPPNPTHVLALPCGLQGLPASALSIAHLLDTRQAGGWVVVC